MHHAALLTRSPLKTFDNTKHTRARLWEVARKDFGAKELLST